MAVNDAGPTATTVGEIDPGDVSFEMEISAVGRDGRPMEGPFVLLGNNVHYVDSLGALVVD